MAFARSEAEAAAQRKRDLDALHAARYAEQLAVSRLEAEVESEAAAVAPLESSLMSERLRNRHETNALEQATEHAEATLEKARKYQKRGRDQEAKWRDREAELGGEIHDAHAAARRRRDVATELELEVQRGQSCGLAPARRRLDGLAFRTEVESSGTFREMIVLAGAQ